MGFTSIRFYHYRNIADQEIRIEAPKIFLVGENGQGKTNFIEAVYLLCYGSSFRTRIDRQLCRHGSRDMSVFGRYDSGAGGTMEIQLKYEDRKKSILVHGKPVHDRKQLIEHIPCVVFTHDDIQFVNGTPDRKRWFLDQTMSMYDPMFIDELRTYRKILGMRNNAIKDERTDLLDILDIQLADAGMGIQVRRSETIGSFNRVFGPIFAAVSNSEEEIVLSYGASWRGLSSGDEVVGFLRSKRRADSFFKTTTSGPHRDRIRYMTGKRDYAESASTGQLRLLSLVLRVAQARFFSNTTGRAPLLLLDDVLLELDGRKREEFLGRLPEYEQAFFTFLPDERFLKYRTGDTAVFRVSDGRIING